MFKTKRDGSPEFRTTIFYFLMFANGGAGFTYAGIWFANKGLSTQEIGVINSAPIFVMLLINLFVGRLADKLPDWRQAIVIGMLIAGVLPLGLFFANDFWMILLFWGLSGVIMNATVPVADAATMRMTRRRGSDYGTIRAWATVGFLVAILISGFAIDAYGDWLFLPIFTGLALLRGATALILPNFRAGEKDLNAPVVGATKLLQVMKPWFLLPLAGWAMIFATHLILNAFQGLLWAQQGIGLDVIGLLIGLGALSEALMLFAYRRFFGGYPARYMILIAAGISALRWVAMAYSPGVPVLIALQSLHAFTFAMGFLASINFVANWTSEDIAAEAQSFLVMLQQGFGVVAIVGFGWLVADYGPMTYLASAAFAATGGVMVWASLKMKSPSE